jgi:hypothetical protein
MHVLIACTRADLQLPVACPKLNPTHLLSDMAVAGRPHDLFVRLPLITTAGKSSTGGMPVY